MDEKEFEEFLKKFNEHIKQDILKFINEEEVKLERDYKSYRKEVLDLYDNAFDEVEDRLLDAERKIKDYLDLTVKKKIAKWHKEIEEREYG